MDASHPSKGLLAGAKSLLDRLGVRGRLLLAFLGISAFSGPRNIVPTLCA